MPHGGCQLFLQKQIRDVRDPNIALPQSSTSRVSSFSADVCPLPVYAVWTLKGLPAERAPTIKSAKGLSKSEIFDQGINESVPLNCRGPCVFIKSLIVAAAFMG